jgi:hypothetical protein
MPSFDLQSVKGLILLVLIILSTKINQFQNHMLEVLNFVYSRAIFSALSETYMLIFCVGLMVLIYDSMKPFPTLI